MKSIWIITKRELQSYFDSLIAYFIIAVFLGLNGIFTWILPNTNIFLVGQASLQTFFSISYWTLFFFIPAITMRLLAEEKRTGTIELLLTKSITNREVVVGKFFAALILITITLAFTLPYIITVASIGNLDLGATITGYIGLFLMSAAYISIGLFASSLTGNQIIAFLTALFISLFFHIIFGIISNGLTGWFGQLFDSLSLSVHYDGISRGVLDLRDIIYFLSIIIIGLFFTEISLSKRNN
jgi:ABC-2 type transport system permease protein